MRVMIIIDFLLDTKKTILCTQFLLRSQHGITCTFFQDIHTTIV